MVKLKRLALVALGVVTILGAAEVTLEFFGDNLPERSSWPTIETEIKDLQLKGKDNWDVVFLGSSVTESAVDPQLMDGVSAYNAALPFSTPISNEVWYRTEFSGQPGRTVVLGLLAKPYRESTDDDLLKSGIETASKTETSILDSLSLYRFRGFVADWFDLRSRERSTHSELWTQFGHQTVYYEQSVSGDAEFPPYGEPRMSVDVREAIVRLADVVHRHGGTLVLMIEPTRLGDAAPSSLVNTYIDSVRQLAHEVGARFWDTYSLGWDSRYYADHSHFNRTGTEAFTELVSDLLAEEVASLQR